MRVLRTLEIMALLCAIIGAGAWALMRWGKIVGLIGLGVLLFGMVFAFIYDFLGDAESTSNAGPR